MFAFAEQNADRWKVERERIEEEQGNLQAYLARGVDACEDLAALLVHHDDLADRDLAQRRLVRPELDAAEPVQARRPPRLARAIRAACVVEPAADYAEDPRAVAEAARRLVELRDRWLNPPEWVELVDEPVPGYPKRLLTRNEAAAMDLKTCTLTNLYYTRSHWLADAHAALDAAVASAYGWDVAISEEEALRELLVYNHTSWRPNWD